MGMYAGESEVSSIYDSAAMMEASAATERAAAACARAASLTKRVSFERAGTAKAANRPVRSIRSTSPLQTSVVLDRTVAAMEDVTVQPRGREPMRKADASGLIEVEVGDEISMLRQEVQRLRAAVEKGVRVSPEPIIESFIEDALAFHGDDDDNDDNDDSDDNNDNNDAPRTLSPKPAFDLLMMLLEWSQSPPYADVVGLVPLAVIESITSATKAEKRPKCMSVYATFCLFIPLLVLILQGVLLAVVQEAGTSFACTPATQTGCHRGMYCSLAFARGQCNDCAVMLDTLEAFILEVCPDDFRYDFLARHPQAFNNAPFPGGCAMYAHCKGYVMAHRIQDRAHPLPRLLTSRVRSLRGSSKINLYALLNQSEPVIGAPEVEDMGDIDINRCDYLVDANYDMKLHHILIVFVGAFLATVPIVTDGDECDTESATFHEQTVNYKTTSRLSRLATKARSSAPSSAKGLKAMLKIPMFGTVIQYFWYFIFSCYICLRKNLLPTFVVSTTVVILTSYEGEHSFAAVSIFLNIVAVGFICEVDNLFGVILLNGRVRPIHEAMIADLADSVDPEMRLPVRWLENRIRALFLCLSIGFESLFMTDLILLLNPLFGGDFFDIANTPSASLVHRVGPNYPNDANCNKVVFAIQAMTLIRMWICSIITLVFDVWRACALRRGKLRRDKLVTSVVTFVSSGFFLYLVYRALVKLMVLLREGDRAFKCNWEGCEAFTSVPTNVDAWVEAGSGGMEADALTRRRRSGR